jgi:hypothetical protein
VPPNCCTVTSKYVPTASAKNRAINNVRLPWEMCQNFQKTAQQFLLEICATITVIRTIWNTYSTDFNFCLDFHALFPAVRNSKIRTVRPFLLDYSLLRFLCLQTCCTACSISTIRPAFNVVLVASIFVLVCCLGMHALALRNGCSLAARKCSLSCSLKNENNYPRMGAPLYHNRPHEVVTSLSNPMAEIRFDEWLRLDVSSLTLTLVIKSPFNLNLTN